MKKLFYMTALAATMGLATSCSQDEELAVHSGKIDSNTIAFATSQAKAQTRSGESICMLNKFTASAVNDDNTSFFSNEEFTYNSPGIFKSKTPYYWPATGTLSFYAISDVGTPSVEANNIPHYTYTDWAAEKDIVAATVKAGEKEIPYPLTFRHLTSQIHITLEAEDKTERLSYSVVSIKMTAPSTGTYSFDETTGGVGSWEIDNTKTSEYSYDGALPIDFTWDIKESLYDYYWNILPVYDGDLYFRIEYLVYQEGKVIADYTGSKYRECTIKNPQLAAGKIYTYNFLIPRSTNDEITFYSDVYDWSDGTYTDHTPIDPNLAECTPVDLGLPSGLKWAKGNLGAYKEYDEGLYYAWGETTGYAKGSGHSFNSKNYNASSIAADLTLSQDAAHVKLGDSWRMPTKDEFTELINNTNSSWVRINGVNGYKFVNKTDATKYIFLPAVSCYSETTLSSWDIFGSYGSSTFDTSDFSYAMNFDVSGRYVSITNRTNGLPIRAVCD